MPILSPALSGRKIAGLALVAGLLWASPGRAEEPKSRLIRATDLKAVFLFHFTSFVEWPAQTFTNEAAPFVIGILGHDPFGKNLDEIVAGETIDNRPLTVRRGRELREIGDCQILYISDSETPRLNRILDQVRGRGILTVGESENFVLQGGMVRFYQEQGRLRLEINPDAAKAAGLTISSQLLRQVRLVEGKGGPP